MTIPLGIQHVETALDLVDSLRQEMERLDVESSWKVQAQEKLANAQALLESTKDQFFLKTRMSTPFARRCEEAARALGAAWAEFQDGGEPDGHKALDIALDTMAKAARTLDERSQMRGMAIT